MYLPLKFAQDNSTETFEYLLHAYHHPEEIGQLTPENILHLAHDRYFFRREYQGPLKELNFLISHLPVNETFFGKTQKEEWRDVLSMNGLIGLWSRDKQVYQFDPDFARELAKTDGLRAYPHMLRHLPYKTFYLDFSNLPGFAPFSGMFCHVEVKENDDILILGHRLVGDIYYTCSANLQENVRQYDNGIAFYDYSRDKLVFRDQVPLSKYLQKEIGNKVLSNAAFPDIWMFYIQFLMYLSSKEPEIEENAETKKTYRPSATVKNRYAEIRKWDVGVRYGNTIRMMSEKKSIQDPDKGKEPVCQRPRKPPRPHSRCAHWQLYWTGKGRKIPEVKWIAPTFVGPRADGSTVIHRVTE